MVKLFIIHRKRFSGQPAPSTKRCAIFTISEIIYLKKEKYVVLTCWHEDRLLWTILHPCPKSNLGCWRKKLSDDSALQYRGNNWDVSCTLIHWLRILHPATLQGAWGTCGLWNVPVMTWRTVTLGELVRYTQGRPLLSGTDYNGCFYLNGTGWGQLDLAMVVATELSARLKIPPYWVV